MTKPTICFCDTGKPYADCCEKYLEGKLYPQDVQALMRSRYSAYCLLNIPYLLKTWHTNTRPNLSLEALAPTQWQHLEVLNVKNGLKKSTVTFNAFYTENGEEKCLREQSLFKKVKNRWYYVDALND